MLPFWSLPKQLLPPTRVWGVIWPELAEFRFFPQAPVWLQEFILKTVNIQQNTRSTGSGNGILQ